MIKRYFMSGLLSIACMISVVAKDKKGVIMTVDGEEIPTEEFLYLYNKNNQQQAQPQTLEEYLVLFENYRLKVAEAKSLGKDTLASFQKEIETYRKDLLEPYVTDTIFFNRLVDVAAEREKEMVESSHIMIIRSHDKERDARNLALLDSLRTELLNGADFIELAKAYSQDKYSSEKGGYLGYAPAGTFPYGFETAVYETPQGEISEIIESHVGWHLVKPGNRKAVEEFKRQPRSYSEVKADVARKTSSPFDIRYHQLRKNIVDRLKAKHPEINTTNMPVDSAYNILIGFEEIEQYANNPDYRNLVDEYINGSLLYEVSVENVWNKASEDQEGIQAYFDANKDKYKWETPHAKGLLIQVVNDSVKQAILTSIDGMPVDSVAPYINKNFKKEAQIDRFNVTQGTNAMIDNIMFGGEPTTPSIPKFTEYFVLQGRIVEQPEELQDVKGAVINDYQEALEKEWVASLHKKHQVAVNEKELKDLKKRLRQ